MVFGFLKHFGHYPAGFNEKVHGPYNPSIYYGKKDTPLAEVKVGELFSWLGRRNKSPPAMMGAISRAYWRWQFKYYHPKRSGVAPFIQCIVFTMTVFYIINYEKMQYHKHYKYHF